MLTDRQREALAAIENHLGAQDPALARALDTLAAPTRVSRSRRCARWVFLAGAVIVPLLTVTALVVIPLPLGLLTLAVLAGTACAHGVARRHRVARIRRLRDSRRGHHH
jgi:hypothetical protein